MVPYSFDTNTNPPWFSSVIGGKRPKSKAKAKAATKTTEAPADNQAEAVFEIMQNRMKSTNSCKTVWNSAKSYGINELTSNHVKSMN